MMSTRIGSHRYVPASCSDSRSPCPALNALANHNYIPHDGRNISIFQLVRAIRNVYNLSSLLAWLIAIGGVIACGCCCLSLDLHQFARHDRIEHDGSLVHDDAHPGADYAPSRVDCSLLKQLLECASDPKWMTLNDLILARAKRNSSLFHPLSTFHTQMANGECALTSCVFQDDNGMLPKDYLYQWFGKDQLPNGWKGPSRAVGFLKTFLTSRIVAFKVSNIEKHNLHHL